MDQQPRGVGLTFQPPNFVPRKRRAAIRNHLQGGDPDRLDGPGPRTAHPCP
jgi:hypothetical protein